MDGKIAFLFDRKFRLILLLVLPILIFATAYYMIWLSNEELLWGHLPMLIFGLGWLFVLVLFSKYFYKEKVQQKYFGLSLLSGILLYLGFPTMPFTFLMFVAFVPLLIMESEISKAEKKPFWKVWRYAYNSFIIWNILSTFWVGNTSFAPGIFAMAVNSLLMSIPFMLYHVSKRFFNAKFGWVIFAAYWISFEKLHQWWELSWTWLTLGNAFSMFPSCVQWYEYTGVFGGTLWIIGLNFMLFKFYRSNATYNLKNLYPILGCLLIPIVLSLFLYVSYEEKGVEQEVLIMQPNFEPHYEKFTIPRDKQFRQFEKLAKSGLTEKTEYLLFPETSFNRLRTNNLDNEGVVRKLERLAAPYPNLKLVSGVNAHRIYTADEKKPTRTIREHGEGERKVYYEAYNAAIQLGNVDSVSLYKKSILVPGAEIFPYNHLFSFMKPLVDQLGGSVEGHGIQEERSVFWNKNNDIAIAPVICYESIYGEYCTEYIRKGANAIFIMTNDGWWDNTAGHKQHHHFARLRAVETRRAIARSANTGISSFINQRGDVVSKTAYEEEAAHLGTIKMNKQMTFYALWGDMIARIAFLGSIIFILNSIAKRLMKPKQPSAQ